MTSPSPHPLISVIILGSPASSFLPQAIASVHAQGIEHLEILIGDDIQQARGRYIAFLESDGAFEADALRSRLDYLQQNPEAKLVHSPVKLIDDKGNDLGATISRPKEMAFDAAVNPIHLSGVMGETALFRGLSLHESEVPGWYQGWLLFAKILSTGTVSHYVEHCGAQHRVIEACTLATEHQQHDSAIRDVLGWIYAPSQLALLTPDYRVPPLRVARRLREFSLFIWSLISDHTQVCRSMMESAGLVAFLNTWLVKSIKDEIHLQVARHYRINLKTQPGQLAPGLKQNIMHQAIQLGLEDSAPSVLLALCECFGIAYPHDSDTQQVDGIPAHSPMIVNPPALRPFVLITTFRTEGAADEVRNCAEILLENCRIPLISHLHVLLEGPVAALENSLNAEEVQILRSLLASGKLIFSPIFARPHYQTLFNYANSLGKVTAAIVNADMLLPTQAVHDLTTGRAADGSPIYALTRWNQTSTGEYLQSLQPHTPWSPWTPNGRCHFEKNYLSYDCYVFDTPVSVPAELASVLIGTLGCDTAIAALLRTEGYSVRNPCLSVRTLHRDEKLRDYSDQRGQQHLKNNIKACASGLLRKYAQHAAYSSSLHNLQALNKKTAWLGGPGSTKVMPTIFLNLGASPWGQQHAHAPFSILTIHIQHGDLESAATELARIPDAIDQDLFIMWELSGFGPEGGHIADLLIKHERFEALGYPLFGYQRQAIIHRDLASKSAQQVLDDMCHMIGEILRR
ncbi:hypothetical protein LG201_11380 [Methylobacillus gramineus]|uniref:hypothetical protein n=1 Tax=Methylobacillus gramineus TaxID=755169 RepID=UPI001CFFE1CD|nr:hypothetical protein [Methylobacillus gramineus]MCB5185803.1 hypothetical protein [Methylobacillus gramineus]